MGLVARTTCYSDGFAFGRPLEFGKTRVRYHQHRLVRYGVVSRNGHNIVVYLIDKYLE